MLNKNKLKDDGKETVTEGLSEMIVGKRVCPLKPLKSAERGSHVP